MTDSSIPQRLRSVLYMPGANERALEKARTIDADALILDLEDAVAPDAKAPARERVCAAAASGVYGARVVAIRVNAAASEWHEEDIRAVAGAGADAIVLPKVDSPAEVLALDLALRSAGAADELKIWAMLESPAAVLHAHAIAAASERLSVLVLGTNDLVKELYASQLPGRGPLLTALSLCLIGARAAGKQILDGVYNDVRDEAGFRAECLQGKQLGFDGKTLIHPGQVEPCNQIWSPDPEEIAHARRVIAAFEQGSAGVVTVDGRMIENLHVEIARRVLALAR